MFKTLPPYPDSPNCVCSQSESSSHFISPIEFDIDPAQAWKTWCNLIANHRSLDSIESSDSHLHAVFVTRIFRFKDDLSCILVEDERLIHVRSASRLGYWDLGANRKRVEELRSLFSQTILGGHEI